jgi:uncharacterized protein
MKRLIIIFQLLVWDQTVVSQDGKLPIIDVHIHSRTKPDRNEKGEILSRPCFPEPCEKIPPVIKKDEEILQMTLGAMVKYNIVKGVISHYGLENVHYWKSKAPDRFIEGIMYGPPLFTSDRIADGPLYIDLGRIREELVKGNLKVIGEVTSQYFNYAANDPALDPVFSLAEEFDVPVHIHQAGLGGDPNFPIIKGSPLQVSEVLRKHPKLRIYIENAGFPFLEDITSLMYVYPNVYADLSTITWIIPRKTFHNYLKGLIDAGLGKRLMFGSDAMIWPEVIGLAIEGIDSAPFLTAGQKRDIFYNNAVKFLRLRVE